MSEISFTVTRADRRLIEKIAARAMAVEARNREPEDRRKHVRGVLHSHCNRYVRAWLTLERARAILTYLEAHERSNNGAAKR